MKGAWRATASYSEGLRFNPDGSVQFPFGFPGFEEGFYFEQVPALTFSVWLAHRWFLEVSVVTRFEDNTLLLGYLGKPGEFVQKVLIGNKDAGIGVYDFIDLPAQSKSSLGASALFQTPASSHELLLRFDSTTEAKKVFIGKGEMSERLVSPASFLSARYFMLPDADVENAAVYLEDVNGASADASGHRYRKATTNEIFLDAANGFLSLLIEHKGRIAVHYTKGANTVGDNAVGMGTAALPNYTLVSGKYYIDPAAAGIDFYFGAAYPLDDLSANARQVNIDSKVCLLVWEPGTFSPFEMLSAYDLGVTAPQDLSKVRITVVPKGQPDGSYAMSPPVYFDVTPGRTFFVVSLNANTRSDFRNHYPFPDTDRQLYGPVLDHIPPFFEYELSVEAATGLETYTLEPKVVPGSISVKRNGLEETRFSYDPNTYAITFNTPIYPYDRIEVFYRVSVAERNAGDIVFGWGNKFPFSPLASLDLALGLRWNILPGAYSEHAYSKTGALVFSAALAGAAEHYSYRLSGALSYSNPDTTGIMRLAGMEGDGLEVEPSEDLGTPCAEPPTSEIPGLAGRGRLFYKDYRDYDAVGGSRLMPYDWTPPADQEWSYTNGSKPGPYLVAGDSQSENGQSLVLDFELDALNDWVGVQLPVSYRNGSADLSGIRSIIASLRAVDVSPGGGFDVYVQLGAAGEDSDGDGILDAETSELSSGYTFNDADNAAALLVGGGPKNEGNGVINTEDLDGNGGLDAEDPNLMFTSGAVAFNADTAWTTYPLSVLDQNALKKSRALRIIIVNTIAGPTAARLLVDRILLAGCGFWSNVDAGGYTSFGVDEVSEALAGVPLLADSWSEVRDTFHNSGDAQEVLRIQWAGGAGMPGWTVKRSLGSGVEGIRYRRLVFYAYRNAAADGELSFSLLDVAGRGAKCSFPAASLSPGSWRKVSLDLFDNSLTINDAAVTPTSVSVDGNSGSLVFFSLSSADTSVSGMMLLDEIHLRDPDSRLGAAAAFSGNVVFQGPILSLGGVSLISDLSVTEQAQGRTAGFSTLYSRPQDEASFRSLSNLKVGVFFTALEIEFLADSLGDEFTFSGGHSFIVPRIDFPIVVTDRFSEKTAAAGTEFSRENTLRFTLPNILTLGLQASAFSRESVLSQTWNGALSVNALAPYDATVSAQWFQSAPGFTWNQAWYLADWIDAYAYLLPWADGAANARTYRGSLTQVLGTKPFGVKLAFASGFGSYDITASTHRQRDDLSLIVSIPFELGPLAIEPYYSRTLSALDLVTGTGGLEEDTVQHFSRYAAYSFFFTMTPLYEIFSPDVNAEFMSWCSGLEQADYKPEIGLTLSRRFGSSLLDLFLPSKIVFSYGKEYVMQQTLFNAFERLSGTVLWNAVNMFGAKGAYRVTPLYDIDSFATSFKAAMTFRENRLPESSSLSVESAYTFESAQGDKLIVRNLFSADNAAFLVISDKGGVEYNWFVIPLEGIALPLIDEKTAKTGRFSHKESVEVRFANLQTTTTAHPVNIVLKHETAILYPDFGYLRGEIALGFDEESYPEAGDWRNVFIAGFRLTLELNVKF
ncbi:MAG: hypothetical protein JXD23_06195 [Spirochaetales bacterium]|nr:hypothetical protein [Spirochaetales bacterium]